MQRAAEQAAAAVARSGRLADPVLTAPGILTAVDAGPPIQIHTGFDDRDLHLHRTNPLLPFLRTAEVGSVPVLLHCYPYEREAGCLAQAFGNVHLDDGRSLNHLGARAKALVARSYEMAPFAEILYSSDAWGRPELQYLGARLWRNAVGSVLGDRLDAGEWTEQDAHHVLSLAAQADPRLVHGLPSPEATSAPRPSPSSPPPRQDDP